MRCVGQFSNCECGLIPGHRTHLKDVQVGTEPLPHLQSLLDTSPWGSAPSNTVCTESYATVSAGDSSTVSQ